MSAWIRKANGEKVFSIPGHAGSSEGCLWFLQLEVDAMEPALNSLARLSEPPPLLVHTYRCCLYTLR